jgi:hypothetical protein
MLFLVDVNLKSIFKIDSAQLDTRLEEIQLLKFFEGKVSAPFSMCTLKSKIIKSFDSGDCSVLAMYAAMQFLRNSEIKVLSKCNIRILRYNMGRRIIKLVENVL